MSSQHPNKVLIIFGDHHPAFLLGGKVRHLLLGSKNRDTKFSQQVQRHSVACCQQVALLAPSARQSSTLKCSWARR